MGYHDRLERIEQYAADRGVSVATIGNKVAANARLIERLRRRVDLTESDLARIEAYIEANPIAKQRGNPSRAVQGDVTEKAGP